MQQPAFNPVVLNFGGGVHMALRVGIHMTLGGGGPYSPWGGAHMTTRRESMGPLG